MNIPNNKYHNLLQDEYKREQETDKITTHLSSQLIEAGQSKPLDGLTLLVTSLATAMIIGGVLLSLWA